MALFRTRLGWVAGISLLGSVSLPVPSLAFSLDTTNKIAFTDGSQNDVAAAIAAAAVTDGWTIAIPAGAFTWTGGVNISGKGVHLRGAGSGRILGRSTSSVTIGVGSRTFTTQSGLAFTGGGTVRVINMTNGNAFMQGTVSSYSGTTLTVNVTSSGGSGTNAFWAIATDPRTIINNAGGTAVSIAEDTTHSVEVSGIKFLRTGGGGGAGVHVSIQHAANGRPVLIHDCWMSASVNSKHILAATSHGVVWNNSFDSSFNSTFPADPANIQAIGRKWEGGKSTWATLATFGTRDSSGTSNFYIEDNDFHGMYLQSIDLDDNSRTVIRYNLFNNSAIVAHGQDTSPDGPRHFEIYNNTFLFNDVGNQTYNVAGGYIHLRGGTGVVTDNTFANLSSSFWGNRSELVFTVQHIRRKAGNPSCWHQGPPAPRQVGYGYVTGAGNTGPGGYQGDLEPVYLWNNAGTFAVGWVNYQPDECGNNQLTENYVRSGIEYIMDTAKPTYVKYSYPHPLRSGGGSTSPPLAPAPSAPQNVRIIR